MTLKIGLTFWYVISDQTIRIERAAQITDADFKRTGRIRRCQCHAKDNFQSLGLETKGRSVDRNFLWVESV